jgi:ERCC4-type nuclease
MAHSCAISTCSLTPSLTTKQFLLGLCLPVFYHVNGHKSSFSLTMPGCRTFASSSVSVTVKIKPVKAACPENQDAVDRLQERLIEAQANPNSNFVHTLRRGMVSVRECRYPITTQKQACELKNVGPSLAKIIVPSDSSRAVGKRKSGEASPGGTTAKARKETAPKTIVAPVGRPQPSFQQQQPAPTIDISHSTATISTASAPTSKEKAYAKAKAEAETLVLPSKGPWKVVLVIDGRERHSKEVVSHCKQSGIPCEERHLPIGDMAWIAQCVQPKTNGMSSEFKPIEIMVGTIIERKQVLDLAASLYGTRYSEQRLRLKQCGLPQVLFLVEGDITQVANCPSETLQMAMMETRIQCGFQIVQTKNMSETVRVLKGLHRRIVQRTFPAAFDRQEGIAVPSYVADPTEEGPRTAAITGRRRNRRPSSLLEMVFDTKPVPPFGASRFITYNELKAKVLVDREKGTKSVQALTMAMLKQIPSLSQKKCTAIAEQYPTMNRLIEAMCYHEGNPESLISGITVGRQTIGPSSASEVFTACCTLGDGSMVASHVPAKLPAKKNMKRGTAQPKAVPSVQKAPPTARLTATNGGAVKKGVGLIACKTQPNGYDSTSDDSFSVAPLGTFTSTKRQSINVETSFTTPANKRKAPNNDPLSDLSELSLSMGSLGGAAPKRAKVDHVAEGKYQSTYGGTKLDDSFFFTSPDESLLESEPRHLKQRARIRQNGNSTAYGNVKPDPPVIDILDSDSDGSPVTDTRQQSGRAKAINHYEQNLQRSKGRSILDTPSTTSTFSTPGMPSTSRQVARKVSNDSSGGKSDPPLNRDLGSTDLVNMQELQSLSLRERLAKMKEVIEIDL